MDQLAFGHLSLGRGDYLNTNLHLHSLFHMTTRTPQSEQAATTPGRAEELAAWLEECAYEEEDSAVKGREIAALLRAQSAELLDLRADKDASMPLIRFLAAIPIEAFGWGEEHRTRTITAWNWHELRVGHVLDARAALNSPTQKPSAS